MAGLLHEMFRAAVFCRPPQRPGPGAASPRFHPAFPRAYTRWRFLCVYPSFHHNALTDIAVRLKATCPPSLHSGAPCFQADGRGQLAAARSAPPFAWCRPKPAHYFHHFSLTDKQISPFRFLLHAPRSVNFFTPRSSGSAPVGEHRHAGFKKHYLLFAKALLGIFTRVSAFRHTK